MILKPHGGKRQGAGRPKGLTRVRKKTKAVTFRVSPERHASYAKAAGGRIQQSWICAALDQAAERQVKAGLWSKELETCAKEMKPHVVKPFKSERFLCEKGKLSGFWKIAAKELRDEIRKHKAT